jgi:hypothetical protein
VSDPAANEKLNRLERWAEKVAEESAQLSPDISEQELRDQEASWYADFYAVNGDWALPSRDEAEMRSWLVGQEDVDPALADAILVKLKGLVAAR